MNTIISYLMYCHTKKKNIDKKAFMETIIYLIIRYIGQMSCKVCTTTWRSNDINVSLRLSLQTNQRELIFSLIELHDRDLDNGLRSEFGGTLMI